MRPLSFKEEQERAKIINDTLLTWSQCPLPPEGIDKLVFTFEDAKQPFECFGLNIEVRVYGDNGLVQNVPFEKAKRLFNPPLSLSREDIDKLDMPKDIDSLTMPKGSILTMLIKEKEYLVVPTRRIPIHGFTSDILLDALSSGQPAMTKYYDITLFEGKKKRGILVRNVEDLQIIITWLQRLPYNPKELGDKIGIIVNLTGKKLEKELLK